MSMCPCCSVPLNSFMLLVRGAVVRSSTACPSCRHGTCPAGAIGSRAVWSCLCGSFGERGATCPAGAHPGVEPLGRRPAQEEHRYVMPCLFPKSLYLCRKKVPDAPRPRHLVAFLRSLWRPHGEQAARVERPELGLIWESGGDGVVAEGTQTRGLMAVCKPRVPGSACLIPERPRCRGEA